MSVIRAIHGRCREWLQQRHNAFEAGTFGFDSRVEAIGGQPLRPRSKTRLAVETLGIITPINPPRAARGGKPTRKYLPIAHGTLTNVHVRTVASNGRPNSKSQPISGTDLSQVTFAMRLTPAG